MTCGITFAALAIAAVALAQPTLAPSKLAHDDRDMSKSSPSATTKVEPASGQKVRGSPRIFTERLGELTT